MKSGYAKTIHLPEPQKEGRLTVGVAIAQRKSVRQYSSAAISLPEVSSLLWAAGGVTCDGVTGPSRSFPSAGACYPLEIYLVAGRVTGLEPGVYRYNWGKNTLELKQPGDLRRQLAQAARSQQMIVQAPISIVFTGVFSRTSDRYGQRGERYVYMDLGHAGQNVYLQAEDMGLGTVAVGAFADAEVKKVLNLPSNEDPLYIMPVGKKEQK